MGSTWYGRQFCGKDFSPATELATIPGRSHWIPGFCLIYFAYLGWFIFVFYFCYCLGHSTSYCWLFYELQIAQLCKNEIIEFLKIHLCLGSFSAQTIDPFVNLFTNRGKMARFRSLFSIVWGNSSRFDQNPICKNGTFTGARPIFGLFNFSFCFYFLHFISWTMCKC